MCVEGSTCQGRKDKSNGERWSAQDRRGGLPRRSLSSLLRCSRISTNFDLQTLLLSIQTALRAHQLRERIKINSGISELALYLTPSFSMRTSSSDAEGRLPGAGSQHAVRSCTRNHA